MIARDFDIVEWVSLGFCSTASIFTHFKKNETWSFLNTLRPSRTHLPNFFVVMT